MYNRGIGGKGGMRSKEKERIIILLLYTLIVCYDLSMPIKENANIVLLDSVLENLINKATLDSLNNITQE